MAQAVKILPYQKQGPVYFTQSILGLQMTWQHKVPWHQQAIAWANIAQTYNATLRYKAKTH